MTDRPLDAERVAALLDGRLSTRERAQVLAQMAAHPDWREVAADAAAVLGDEALGDETPSERGPLSGPSLGDAAGGASPVVPNVAPHTTSRRLGPWLGLAAAASLGVFVLMRDGTPGGRADAPWSPARATSVVLAPDERAQLVQDRWIVVRAGTQVLNADAVAVRLGALSVDAYLDREGGGAEAIDEMRSLLETVDGSAAASRLLEAASDSASRGAAFAVVRGLVPTDAYDAGVWLELRRAGVPGDAEGLSVVARVVERRGAQEADAAELRGTMETLEAQVRRGDARGVRDAATAVLRGVGS